VKPLFYLYTLVGDMVVLDRDVDGVLEAPKGSCR
jgi:hypothetical protein